MTIEKYTALTGIEVAEDEQAAITANIRRTKSKLEALLGYSLSKKTDNQYEELGKTTADCGIISPEDIDEDSLAPKDDVIGSYRLFHYNPADKYFVVDPFTKVHAVKLVFVRMGDEPNGITHKTFGDSRVRVDRTGNVSKYIQRVHDCLCTCRCVNECVQIAVDADWLNEDCLPDELLYIWADMVEFYANPEADIKSETLGTHRYEKFDRKAPQDESVAASIIQKYAGPNGEAYVGAD